MKRGLSTLDTERTPRALYEARIDRLRGTARERGLDAILVYGDVSSGGDIAYLTHTTLYWGHAILVVPADGDTQLTMSLSPRTRDWFDATGVLQGQRSGPRIGALVRELADERGYRTLGVVDEDYFPAALLDAVTEGGQVTAVDLGPEVRRLRSVPDEPALADLSDSAALGRLGLAAADAVAHTGDPARVRADAEHAMRAAGAWDATAEVTPGGHGTLCVRVRCQLRDAWFAAERPLHPDEDSLAPVFGKLFAELLGTVRAGATQERLTSFAEARITRESKPGGDLFGIGAFGGGTPLVEVLLESAPDVESRHVLGTGDAFEVPEGGAVHIALRVWGANGALLAAWGDTVLVSADGATALAPGGAPVPGEHAPAAAETAPATEEPH